jgi:nicotinate-nucleotide pyrophosphorylase (carboxylating)
MEMKEFVRLAIIEDIKDGDHSALACIPEDAMGKAKLLVKATGILAGVEEAKAILLEFDPEAHFTQFLKDGDAVKDGDVAFHIECKSRALLGAERLILNVMQRMSAIATLTANYVKAVEGLSTQILDTRKTTPLLRFLEKKAVLIGGGTNHRFGLYDMIMLKDNHIDLAGGIEKAILKTNEYLIATKRELKIEIETRNLAEVEEVLRIGGVHRIMLDNFSFEDLKKAVELIGGRYETESSGGVNLTTVRQHAECGVDFVSVGAITHSVHNMDLSLKAL